MGVGIKGRAWNGALRRNGAERRPADGGKFFARACRRGTARVRRWRRRRGPPPVRPRSAAAAASVQSNAHRSRDGGGRRLPPTSSSRRGSCGVQPVVSAWPPVSSDRRRRRCRRRRLSAAASRRSRSASCVFSRRGRDESLPAPRRVLRAAAAESRSPARSRTSRVRRRLTPGPLCSRLPPDHCGYGNIVDNCNNMATTSSGSSWSSSSTGQSECVFVVFLSSLDVGFFSQYFFKRYVELHKSVHLYTINVR